MMEPICFRYETKKDDVMKALRVIDFKNGPDNRRIFHFLGIGLVFWMFVPQAVQQPGNMLNWLMLALTVAVGLVVIAGPSWQNERFAKSLVASQPQVTATADEERLLLQSADGETIYAFDQPVAMFAFENIIAIHGGRGRINMIPKDQLPENTQTRLEELLKVQLGDQFETVDKLKNKK